MSFKRLKRRVEHAEHLVDRRSRQTLTSLSEMNRAWRAGWTPIRIIVAGLATGFVAGRAEPMSVIGKLGEIRWAQIISIVSTLVTGIQAMVADGLSVMSGMDPEDDGSVDSDDADASAAGAPDSDPTKHRPAERYSEEAVAPRPAEAATELAAALR